MPGKNGDLLAREIKQLPKAVGALVKSYQKRYRTRSCQFDIQSPGWELYLAEGARYTAFNARGEQLQSVQMQSEHSLHAGNKKGQRIGERVPVPEGHWIVEFELFCGSPYIKVNHVGLFQLKG